MPPTHRFPTLENKKIQNLLKKFEKQNIKLKLNDTKKPILIFKKNQTTQKPKLKYKSYTLENPQLKITLSEYKHSTKPTRNLIGAPITRELGILVNLTFEESYKEGIILEKCKKIISKFYQTD